jgi:hypothetical protein
MNQQDFDLELARFLAALAAILIMGMILCWMVDDGRPSDTWAAQVQWPAHHDPDAEILLRRAKLEYRLAHGERP